MPSLVDGNNRFVTTAARIAYAWVNSDLGSVCYDSENGNYYLVIGVGAGVASMQAIGGTLSRYGYAPISLATFREVDANGDVGNAAANGGVLASDTAPILLGGTAESWSISWAASNIDPIQTSISLPRDLDDTRDVTFLVATSSAGTTDLASFTFETGWDTGTLVSDTCTGLASTTITDCTVTVDKADVPAGARYVNIVLAPTAHATDIKLLHGIVMRYFKV
jgi:hypothetical protein